MQGVDASQVEALYSAWLVHLEVSGFKAGSIRAYRSAVSDYIRFITRERVRYDEVSHQALDRWKLHLLREKKIKPATINYYKAALKTFYDWLTREGHVFNSAVDRLKGMKTPRLLPKPIPETDVTKLIDGAGTVQLRAMLETFYANGVRCEELRMMNVGDVDLVSGEIRIMAKGGYERVVVIAGYALEAMRAHLAAGPPMARALWLGPRGKRINQKTIRKQLREVASTQGVEGNIHPHRLRHSFATHMLNHGMGLEGVQKMLGHALPTTTMIYLEVALDRVKAEYLEIHPRARIKPPGEEAEGRGASAPPLP